MTNALPLSLPDFKLVFQLQRAALEEIPRTFRRLMSLPLVLRVARDTRVGQTPHDVVFERGGFKLLRYRRTTPATYAEPILFCYALVNRPYILDLQSDKSVVRHYLERGFDVYMIDWGVPTDADAHLTLEDYVQGFVQGCVDFILKQCHTQKLHLLGYCMGGTLATMFAASHPERVATLTLLATPIDFREHDSLLNLWASAKVFDVDAFVDAYGNCPAWFLQYCFLYLKPVQNLIEKRVGFYEHMTEKPYLCNYFALERWVDDNIPVAGETFRAFVKKLYQRNELVRGEFHLGTQRLQLSAITCPLLLLTAKNDHLVAPASTEGIRPHVSSKEIESLTIDAGHVGLVVSGKAQKLVWPKATDWLSRHSATLSAQPTVSPS